MDAGPTASEKKAVFGYTSSGSVSGPPSPSQTTARAQEGEFERLGSTQTQRVNVRLVAATNRDLADMVLKKQFRSDL